MRYDLSMRVIAILFVCLSLNGCGDVYRYLSSGSVGWAINKEIRYKGQTEVVISRLADFSWNELVVFGAYTRQIEICNRLQLSVVTCQDKIPDEPNSDGLQLLVFLRNKEIVHTELHLAWHGNLQVDDTMTLTPQTAVFLVEKNPTSLASLLAITSVPLISWLAAEAVVRYEMLATGAKSRAALGDDFGLGMLLFVFVPIGSVLGALGVWVLVWHRTKPRSPQISHNTMK